MNFDFAAILDKFDTKARIIALLIMVVAASGTYIWTAIINSDGHNCHPIIEENLRLHADFAKMSEIARKLHFVQLQKQSEQRMSMRELSDLSYERLNDSVMPPAPIVRAKSSELADVETKLVDSLMSITHGTKQK